MQKLKLTLDELVVESFAPAAPVREMGTVRANISGPYTDECYNCGHETDDPCASYNNWTCSCGGTCPNADFTCAAQTCGAGEPTCDGDTCYNDTCSFPQCTKIGIPC